MNFWKTLWPSNSPAHIIGKEQILVLREKILQTLFLSTLALSTLVYGLLINLAIKNNDTTVIVLLTGTLIILLVLTLARKMAYAVRSISFIAILFVLGSASLILLGNSGSGFLLLITSVTVTTILLGPFAGAGSATLSLIAMLLISYGIENGQFTLAPQLPNPNTGLGWAQSGSIFVLVVGVIGSSVSIVVVGLQRALKQSLASSKDLEEQRDTLFRAVEERTVDLERRIVQIRTATEIIRSFSSILHTEELFQYVVDLIRDQLDLYYVGFFLVDPTRQYAILRAGTGDAGQVMMATRHRLPIGGVSMIGWSIANRKPRIALDVEEEGIHFKNPQLPETRSELALPIISRNEALGALTIQSMVENAFDEDDITILQGIADSLGVALENARLFDQSQKDLAEISSLNRQYIQQSWFNETAVSRDLAFTYENPGGHATGPAGQKLQIPIWLRGQMIGQIEIEKDTEEFSGDEIELVESISSQTAVALESARLLQESQRKATQEEKFIELTSRFSQAFDIDDILKIAVKELGQLPSISEVSVQLANQDQVSRQLQQTPQNNGNREHTA